MRRLCALLGLVLVAALAWLWQDPAPAPRDIALPAGPAQRITVLGTSLSANYDWPARLAQACGVQVTVIAKPGANVSWGLTQIGAVVASAPDIVLVEFAINDADLRDGLGLRQSRTAHQGLITALQADLPRTRIALMTMNPAQGLRGWLRPRLGAHYAAYFDLAQQGGVGLIDLYPRWLALPRSARGLQADGLHPDAAVAAGVILPAALAYLGPICSATNPAGG